MMTWHAVSAKPYVGASIDDSTEPSDTTATAATTATTATKQKPAPSLRLLELGAGTGACGILIAAAAAARGMTVDALLTDRNPAALELAACSAALVVAQSTAAAPACIRTARFAFGQDASLVLDAFYNTWCRGYPTPPPPPLPQVGPGRYYPPRHPTDPEPSFLSQIASHGVAGNIRQALAAGGCRRHV